MSPAAAVRHAEGIARIASLAAPLSFGAIAYRETKLPSISTPAMNTQSTVASAAPNPNNTSSDGKAHQSSVPRDVKRDKKLKNPPPLCAGTVESVYDIMFHSVASAWKFSHGAAFFTFGLIEPSANTPEVVQQFDLFQEFLIPRSALYKHFRFAVYYENGRFARLELADVVPGVTLKLAQ